MKSITSFVIAASNRIRATGEAIPIAPSPTCPLQAREYVPEYTFDSDGFASALNGNRLVIHHGLKPTPPGSALPLYRARPVLFTTCQSRAVRLDSGAIRGILSGRVVDWAQLGGPEGVIRLGRHGGRVQAAIFEAMSRVAFSVDVNAAFATFDGYERLAAWGATTEGALVFGLRPAFAGDPRLKVVVVEGSRFGRPDDGSLDVWVGLPQDRLGQAECVRDYISNVVARIAADSAALQSQGIGRSGQYAA